MGTLRPPEKGLWVAIGWPGLWGAGIGPSGYSDLMARPGKAGRGSQPVARGLGTAIGNAGAPKSPSGPAGGPEARLLGSEACRPWGSM